MNQNSISKFSIENFQEKLVKKIVPLLSQKLQTTSRHYIELFLLNCLWNCESFDKELSRILEEDAPNLKIQPVFSLIHVKLENYPRLLLSGSDTQTQPLKPFEV